MIDRRDFAVLDDLHAALASTFGQRLRNVDCIGITIGRYMDAAYYVIRI